MNNSLISQFKGRKCLVTGGAGFIGSNLSRFLKEIGSEVTIIDNFQQEIKKIFQILNILE